MKLTDQIRREIRAYTFAVMRSRDDYAEHPSEFSKPDYCVKCSELTGSNRFCGTCRKTRESRRRRKERAA